MLCQMNLSSLRQKVFDTSIYSCNRKNNLSLLGHNLKHLETLRGVVRTLSSCRGIENGEGCVQVGDEYVAGPFVDPFL